MVICDIRQRLLARVGVDWLGAIQSLVHQIIRHGPWWKESDDIRRNVGTYAQTTLLLLRDGCGQAEEHLVPRSRTKAV